MKESTLTQLKIIVERAVRPVRASIARKRKMREELLAHVSAVFEEEARIGDERAALERTAQRFGDVVDLTRQLQAAVPRGDSIERVCEDAVFSDQSPLRRASRFAGLVGGTSLALLPVLSASLVIAGQARWDEWLTLARLPSLLAPFGLAMLIFCATLIGHGMRQALFGPRGRSWWRILTCGVAAWLLVPGFALVWCVALSGVFVASLVEVGPLFLTGLLAPVALLIIVGVTFGEIRHQQEWASLPIDGDNGVPA